MKSLLISLLMLASSAAYSQQSYSCNVSIGYSCSEDIFHLGKFTRNALCFAYGEEVVSIDEAEESKIFKSIDSCQSISVTESECHTVRNYSEKFCAEISGDYSYLNSSCLICD